MFNSITFWIILGIVLLLSEFLIPGFTIFFFGLGAFITSLFLVIIPPLDSIMWLQVIIFLISSISLFITLRNKFKTTLKGEMFHERDDYTGKSCRVIELVSEKKPGRIEYQGTTWTAYCNVGKIKKNQTATILGKKTGEPMIFIIKKEKENK